MIPRKLSPVLLQAAGQFPVVTLLGPRQSGKTTLVRAIFPDHIYINLENPQIRTLYGEDPKSLLRDGRENLIIDEAQREPEILSWVQVFVDREKKTGSIRSHRQQSARTWRGDLSVTGRKDEYPLSPATLTGRAGLRSSPWLSGRGAR